MRKLTIISLGLVFFGIINCGRVSFDSTLSTIKFKLPPVSPATMAKLSAKAQHEITGAPWGVSDPASFADIGCYGVMIGGPEAYMSENSCSVGPTAAAKIIRVWDWFGGFAPASEQEIEIIVPAGESRSIYVVGFAINSNSTCADFKAAGIPKAELSNPFVIGQAQAALPAGQVTSVVIPVQFDPDKKIGSCEGPKFVFQEPPTTPIGPILGDYGTGADGDLVVSGVTNLNSTATVESQVPLLSTSSITNIAQPDPGIQDELVITVANDWTGKVKMGDSLSLYVPAGHSGFVRGLWKKPSGSVPTKVLDLDVKGSQWDSYYKPAVLPGTPTKLLFAAASPNQGTELWITDGTASGTMLLKDINPGIGDSNPRGFYLFNGKLYFWADDGTHGRELWSTDGTATGTNLVADIVAGIGAGAAPAEWVFKEFNGKLYFYAMNGSDPELHVYDGTTVQMVANVNTNWGTANNTEYGNIETDGTYLYWASRGSLNGMYLFKSTGVVGNGIQVSDVSSNPYNLFHFGSRLYLSPAVSGIGYEPVYIENGGPATLLKDISPGSFDFWRNLDKPTVAGSIFYFVAKEATAGQELWKSDGTTAGTVLVKDLTVGSADSYFSDTFIYNSVTGKLFFVATDGTAYKLWITDGSAAGTQAVYSSNSSDSMAIQKLTFHAADGRIYYIAKDATYGYQLFSSDGTNAGTVMASTGTEIPQASVALANGTSPDTFVASVGSDILFGGQYKDEACGGTVKIGAKTEAQIIQIISSNQFKIKVKNSGFRTIPNRQLTQAISGSSASQLYFCHVTATRIPQLNNLTLVNGGELTIAPQQNFLVPGGNLPLKVKGSVILDSGTAKISASGKGFIGGNGNQAGAGYLGWLLTGYAVVGNGGAHYYVGTPVNGYCGAGGGYGSSGGSVGTATCGLATPCSGGIIGDDYGGGSFDPTKKYLSGLIFMGGGGGGGNSASLAGSGGGVFHLQAYKINVGSGASLLLETNGTQSIDPNGGGGAGGGAFIQIGWLQNFGVTRVEARGASYVNASCLGSGGGGRVQVDVQYVFGNSITASANGGGTDTLPGTCIGTMAATGLVCVP